MTNQELQDRLNAAEAEIAAVRQLMNEQEAHKPPKWEDLMYVAGSCIGTYSQIVTCPPLAAIFRNKSVFPTKEQVEATIAEAQLLQLRDSKFYRNGWKPNWDNGRGNFCVYGEVSGFRISNLVDPEIWSFQDLETAERFLYEQRELLDVWVKKIQS